MKNYISNTNQNLFLSEQQIEDFSNKGFLIVSDCFNAAEIEAILSKAKS